MKRRHFIQVASAGTAQFMFAGILPGLSSRTAWARKIPGSAKRRVAVLGGGVAGMSATHELVERGFEVSVYEMKPIAGGKARSILVPNSGTDGRGDLPGEHGFRFFPGFYQHLPDTMKRIPYSGNANGVFDNLTAATYMEIARTDAPPMITPTRMPQSTGDLRLALQTLFGNDTGVTAQETDFFFSKLEEFLTTCDARRLKELEAMSWWDYVEAGKHSAAYQKYFAIGLTRTLVAARAETMSARTGGAIFTQLLLSVMGQGATVDRMLNGPTSDVWINPWLDHLKRNGVDYHLGASVQSIEVNGGLVSGAWVTENGKTYSVQADYYLACVPIEVIQRLLTPDLLSLDPSLALLNHLTTEWMNGIQFFLKRDIPIVRGHTILIDSPWSLTAFSQPQFWPDYDLSSRGNGQVRGLISVDISNWEVPGIVYGKSARKCSKQEIFQEVWAQLNAHFRNQDIELTDEDLVTWFLDPGITFPSPGETANAEPLLVNTVGTWWDRPTSTCAIPNLFLAADYVRTYTDLASMEAANEAARRAVNEILKVSGASGRPCKLWPFQEPEAFAAGKDYDRVRFELGLPHA